MSTKSANPFVWDRPFAFLWLTSDEGHPLQHTLEQHITHLASNADFKSELPKSEDTPVESIMSFPFMPHVTLHTMKLDEKNVARSLEGVIEKVVELSGNLTPEAQAMKVKLSAPLKGVTHFKSVYLEVERGVGSEEELRKVKEKAKTIFGANEPEEKEYLPHLSLWYGKEDRVRSLTYEEAKRGPVGEGVEEMNLSHLHLVYAPLEDVRSWKLVGTTRVGSGVFFRRTAFIDGKFEFQRKADAFVASTLPGASPSLASSSSSSSSSSNAKDAGMAKKSTESSSSVHGSVERLPIVNPANGETMAYMEGCGKEEAERAIEAANRALAKWSNKEGSLSARLEVIRRMVALMKKKKEYLSRMETMDNGKPLREAEADVGDAIDCFEYYASLAESDNRLNGQPVADLKLSESAPKELKSRVEYEAVGVSVMILPFNYPLLMAAWKLAPSLVAGCTVIVKPSEETSASVMELAAMAEEAGMPRGVLNVLPSLGPSVGPTLSHHPLVRKIAFTGSGTTGKLIMRESTKHLPNVSLELGGKSPAIVFPDANLDSSLDWLLMGIFFNAGQVCSATSRLLIHSSIYEELKAKLIAKSLLFSRNHHIGDGLLPSSLLGPLVSLSQYNRVRRLVEDGIAQGARILIGNENFDLNAVKRPGFFFFPTILENVNDNNILWNQEVFGPVLVLRKWEKEEEAISLANASPFGLAAAVFSQDPQTLQRVSKKLEAGIVWQNCSQPTLIQAPWGGFKESGVGRELGPWGLDNFLEPKQITSWHSPQNFDWYGQL